MRTKRFLAMEQFQYYLDGQRFTLETGHSNLRWIMTIENPQGRLARWITRLTAFDVEFVSGQARHSAGLGDLEW